MSRRMSLSSSWHGLPARVHGQDAHATKKRRRAAALQTLLLLAAALLFTAIIIRYSQRHGRLMLFPTFDDTRYMLEGMEATHALRDAGPAGLLRHWIAHPPHSPWQATLGLLGFSILGANDWAAHASNLLLVIGLLAAGRWALRGLNWPAQIPLLLFVLTIPLAAMGAYEFRPDIAVGIALAWAATWTLSRPLLRAPARHQLAVGAAFGLCLLIKPPFFPMTLIIFALCVFLKLERGTLHILFRRFAAVCARCLLGCAIVAGPYWLIAGRGQWRYFYDVTFGRYRGLWNLPGDNHLRPLYYLAGEGSQIMLGRHLIPLVILVLVGFVLVLYRKRRREIAFAGSMLIVAAAMYIIPAASRKSPFFGVPFQMMLVLGALLSVRMILLQVGFAVRTRVSNGSHSEPYIRASIVTALALFGFLVFQWPERRGDYASPETLSRQTIVDAIHAQIRVKAARDAVPPRIFVTTAGDITARLIRYLALKDETPVDAFDHPNESDLDLFRRSIGRADFVVASESGSEIVATNLPSARVQDQVLDLLRRDPRFRVAGHYPFIRTGKGYYVFERIGQ